MVGRPLCSEQEAIQRGFGSPEDARRRAVLRETIAAFEEAEPPDLFHRHAARNLERWRAERGALATDFEVRVVSGDWGEVTHSLTMETGACFAVLNMANAFVPGGAYVEGAVAQEENMYRRSDCHFHIDERAYDVTTDRYRPAMTRQLTAQDGTVYLDTENPRVCIRGPEDRSLPDLGYPWLPVDQVFPFFELRAAAQDLRGGRIFDPAEARRRIVAQLDTLRDHDVRYAVLGAFGCGAFRNPSLQVAKIYRDELQTRARDFSLVAFAIFSAGYGPGNYAPFARAFAA